MKIVIAECLGEMFKTSHVSGFAPLTAKDGRKLVHDLYAPNEIRQEILFIGTETCYGILKLSALFVPAHSSVLGCAHIISYTF
jgi:hypothetical protein